MLRNMIDEYEGLQTNPEIVMQHLSDLLLCGQAQSDNNNKCLHDIAEALKNQATHADMRDLILERIIVLLSANKNGSCWDGYQYKLTKDSTIPEILAWGHYKKDGRHQLTVSNITEFSTQQFAAYAIALQITSKDPFLPLYDLMYVSSEQQWNDLFTNLKNLNLTSVKFIEGKSVIISRVKLKKFCDALAESSVTSLFIKWPGITNWSSPRWQMFGTALQKSNIKKVGFWLCNSSPAEFVDEKWGAFCEAFRETGVIELSLDIEVNWSSTDYHNLLQERVKQIKGIIEENKNRTRLSIIQTSLRNHLLYTIWNNPSEAYENVRKRLAASEAANNPILPKSLIEEGAEYAMGDSLTLRTWRNI